MSTSHLWRRAAGRLLAAVLVIWAAATLTFIAMRLLPGDPVAAVAGSIHTPTPEARAAIIEEYGFDRPILAQYLTFLGNTATGDFGDSYSLHQSVRQILADRAWPTFQLTISALVAAWALAIGWIILTAGRSRPVRRIGSGLEMLAISVPQLWLAVGLLLLFSLHLGWFPVSGGDGFEALVLPALAMALPLAGYLGQVTREAFENSLEQPFVLSSAARGTADLAVRLRHVLRHAAIPGVTVSGFALGWLLSGAVIVESVFGRPGLGATLLQGVTTNDVPLTGAIVLIAAIVYVLATLVVDLLYPIIDPRIRRS
ncbi:peptide/nickel transport system permease protein [Frankia sp. EI5c]|uniref:ABC transporter permease n=1 Tax=Frankia sp. EI5c TaxID=683316 RepID=UPI0007C3E65C|nr:ABC transporter permease [Frankia sp. EI5c]OAA27498.1 peptide/nickel transport system permease protein [Frankia sp. EI5c]